MILVTSARCLRSPLALTAVLVLSLTAITEAQPGPLLTVSDAGPAPPLAVSIRLDHYTPAHGWAWGMCHDPAGLAVVSTGHGADGSTVNGGDLPDFAQTELFPDGWTVGVVISFVGAFMLPPGLDLEIGTALYDGIADGAWTVCPCNMLGSPVVHTVIVYDGASIVPAQLCGTVSVDAPLAHEFRRGDANIDGAIDLADPIYVLDHLFLAGPVPPCWAAGDADADGAQNIGDVIQLLAYLFSGGPPPAPPFPGCGTDPAADCDVPACP